MLPILLLAADAPEIEAHDVALADRTIRVGDVAIADGYEQGAIGQLPVRTNVVELDEASAERLLRNRYPGLVYRLRFKGSIRLSAPQIVPVHGANSCLSAAVDLQAGQPITRLNTSAVNCGTAPVPKVLRYDADAGSAFARIFIPAGTPLGAPPIQEVSVVPAGQRMTLRFMSGPVIIEREVVTLQPGHPGDHVFAATEDGEVITSRLAPDSEEGQQ